MTSGGLSREDIAARGEAAAHGRRRPLDTKIRRGFSAGFRRLATPEATATIDALSFTPAVRTPTELADLAARINWYLGDVRVPIYVEGANGVSFGPDDAAHMDPTLVHGDRLTRERPVGKHVRRVVHRVSPGSVLRVLPHARSMSIADAVFAKTSELGYYRLHAVLGTHQAPDPLSTMPQLLSLRQPGGKALVLGTGPSASELDLDRVDADIRIVCNSTVRDVSLITKLAPQIICFADPVFHFGPSRYAATFRADVRRALDLCDALVVMPAYYAGLMLAHMPELADRLVCVDDTAPDWCWPSETRAQVRMSGNVLTYLMLPLAYALADNIEVAGCDGRPASQNYFWKHNAKIQYSAELMRDVFAAHPAFFRTTSYDDYYDRHMRYLEEFLVEGENAGKKITAVTRTHIPALLDRGAPRFD